MLFQQFPEIGVGWPYGSPGEYQHCFSSFEFVTFEKSSAHITFRWFFPLSAAALPQSRPRRQRIGWGERATRLWHSVAWPITHQIGLGSMGTGGELLPLPVSFDCNAANLTNWSTHQSNRPIGWAIEDWGRVFACQRDWEVTSGWFEWNHDRIGFVECILLNTTTNQSHNNQLGVRGVLCSSGEA